jgi:hypothetical protein
MKTVTRTHTTTTEKGLTLNMTVTVTKGWEKATRHQYNDGYESDVQIMEETNTTEITIEAKGRKYQGWFSTLVPEEYKKQGVYVIFASAIGLSEKVYNELNAVCEDAKKEVETDEGWIAFQKEKERADKEDAEYRAHVENVNRMMTLNGRTY